MNISPELVIEKFSFQLEEKQRNQGSAHLPQLNRYLEDRLNQELEDIEFEMKHMRSMFDLYPRGKDIYRTLFLNLIKDIERTEDLFFDIDYLDHLSVRALLEKIRRKIENIREKMKYLSDFIYPNDIALNH